MAKKTITLVDDYGNALGSSDITMWLTDTILTSSTVTATLNYKIEYFVGTWFTGDTYFGGIGSEGTKIDITIGNSSAYIYVPNTGRINLTSTGAWRNVGTFTGTKNINISTSQFFSRSNNTSINENLEGKSNAYFSVNASNIYLDASGLNYGGNFYAWNRSNERGTISGNLTLNVPPTCSYTEVIDISTMDRWVQGMSTARSTISNASASYGGLISSITMNIGNSSATISSNGDIDVSVLDSGIIIPQLILTDSRGQTKTYSLESIDVLSYTSPSVSSIDLQRIMPYGESDETQVKISIFLNYVYQITDNKIGVPVVNVNNVDISSDVDWYTSSVPTIETWNNGNGWYVYDDVYKEYIEQTDEGMDLTKTYYNQYLGDYSGPSLTVYGLIDPTSIFSTNLSYNFSFEISDEYSTSERKNEVLPTVFITMDFQAGGKEIAFGDKADDPLILHQNGLFKCAMDVLLKGRLYGGTLPGEIRPYAGIGEGLQHNPPQGWLWCDGSEVDKSAYPELYSVIGDAWGTSSDPTKFKLPDFNGRTLVGYKDTDTDFNDVGNTGGAKGAWRHNHTQAGHQHYSGLYTVADRFGSGTRDAAGAYTGYGSPVYTDWQAPNISASGSTNNNGTNEVTNPVNVDSANMPPYAVVRYIISTGSGAVGGGQPISDCPFPVGFVYISVEDEDPHNLIGGNWQMIGQGRTLMGAGTWDGNSYIGGDEIESGLPNITGSWNNYGEGSGTPAMVSSLTGAIYGINSTSPGWGTSTGLDNDNYQLGFDASRVSSIYGNSTIVQPPALVVYMWKRIS